MSSPTDPIETLTRALENKQPLVLVAGQSFDSANDAILEALLDRFGCTDRDSGWLAALDRGLSDPIQSHQNSLARPFLVSTGEAYKERSE